MRQFRSGRTLPPLILWASLATGGALLLWGREPRLLSVPGVLALILLGPAATLLHALRCSLQNARIDPARGLVLPSGRVLPWSALRAVRYRPAPFRKPLDLEFPESAGDAVLIVLLAQALWALAYCFLLPAFALLSPWHGRVTLELSGGQTVVYHDLEEPEAFVSILKLGMSGRKDREARVRQSCEAVS